MSKFIWSHKFRVFLFCGCVATLIFSHGVGVFAEILQENRYHKSMSPPNGPGLWQIDLYLRKWNPVSCPFFGKKLFFGFSMIN